MSVSKEQEWGYRETDFFFFFLSLRYICSHTSFGLAFTACLSLSTKQKLEKLQSRLVCMEFLWVDFLVSAQQALPSAIVWNQHLVTLPPAPACFMELGDQPLTAALDTQFVRYKELSPSRPEILIQWVRAPNSGFYQLSWWWFWCRWSRNYIWRTLVKEPRLPPGGKKAYVILNQLLGIICTKENAVISKSIFWQM